MPLPQPPTVTDADVATEFADIGEEFGCQRLQGETTDAYGLRLLEYVSEMTTELQAVQSRIRDLLKPE